MSRTAKPTLAPENDLRLLEDRFSFFRTPQALEELSQNHHWILGLDEVGRGCLAGPVCAGAVAYRMTNERLQWKPISRVTDSKKLSETQRLEVCSYLGSDPEFLCATAEASVEEIDQINILRASLLAMKRAYTDIRKHIPESAHVWVLCDGNILPELSLCKQTPVVKGDSLSFAIAAASIFAKQHRDDLMKKLSKEFPDYAWENNVGYPTADHTSALLRIGITQWHRRTFKWAGRPLGEYPVHESCEGIVQNAQQSTKTR